MKKIYTFFTFLFVVLFCQTKVYSQPFTLAGEKAALQDLYAATTSLPPGPNQSLWTNSNGWNSTGPVDNSWHGIQTDGNGFVISINLTNNNLKGGIPPSLKNLSKLQYLYLGDNQLSAIPNDIADNWSNLIVMFLRKNQLTGSIPSSFNKMKLPSMTELWLGSNNFVGGIGSPTTGLGTLDGLHYLELEYNPNLGAGGHNLEALTTLNSIKSITLTGCGFSCPIPNLTGKSSLINCYLAKNNLTASSISNQFVNLSSLVRLGLHENPNLNCPLTAFTDLDNLQELSLNHCGFTGNIPTLNLPSLKKVWLNNNNFTSISSNFGLPSNLEFLALSTNQLTSVPAFNLPNLTKLYLHENQITGNLPNFTLPSIQHFWISNNFLDFGNIKAYTEWNPKITRYAPQKTILSAPTQSGNTLTASSNAGEPLLGNLTYSWYMGTTPTPVYTVIGNNTYTPTISGDYSYKIAHSPVTVDLTTLPTGYKNLVLPSYTTTFATPLPLELLSFTARKQANDVLLNWRTTNEQNTSHFDIQRSTDGTHFSTIGTVKSNNKTTVNDYYFTDRNLPNGTLYYRLEQVDRDEKTTFSPIRSVEKSDKFYYNISPNPTQDVLTINGNADYDLDMTMEVYNEIGSLVHKQETAVNKGSFEQKIDMANFAEGAYIVLLRLPNGFSVKKTVVKIK